ncbi:MAG: hypothetical protein A3G18_13315 [Rhodospirillales bacterium RIFCSPLOWO2_12_FULL_58_28]|nr:MAG: hypothetical protein A3H92_13170 [Rhodospirillales bacterium RIFCSPLOWO2_02_FULL_58_16]OHC78556.1 MAG: hypothetical protein A3G18_13315 [Rhodospirillales bacterium RIFCSPLOWO2_12_FULL_58_28]
MSDVKERNDVSEGYIFKLWELRSRLDFLSARVAGDEKEVILQRIKEVDRNIKSYLGKTPSGVGEIKNLFAEKERLSKVGGLNY